jgi:hypothetical protein
LSFFTCVYEQGETVPPATWELQAKQVPNGIGFWLKLVRMNTAEHEEGLGDIIVWPERMAIKCELQVRKKEGQKLSRCIFRELV